MAYIFNASPQVQDLGTDDRSTRQVYPEPIPTPQHLPLFFLFTKKGPTSRQLVDGAKRVQMFGKESFDPQGPYYNHATLFSDLVNREGNIHMIQRVVPTDAGPPANFRIWADVLQDAVPNYLRNDDGSIQLDPATGDPLVDTANPTIPGLRIKFYREIITDSNGFDYGSATMNVGYMDDGSGNQSTMYPILELKASSQGEYGNNAGIRIYPGLGDEAPSQVLEQGMFPFYISAINRINANSTAELIHSRFGEQQIRFVFKPNALDPVTEAPFDLNAVFPDRYQNTEDPRYPLIYSDYDDIYVYTDNIETIIGTIITQEDPWISQTPIPVPGVTGGSISTLPWYDYTVDSAPELNEQKWLTNFLTFTSTKRAPYFTAWLDPNPTQTALPTEFSEIQFGKYNNLWMGGGSDGTMDNTMYESLVVQQMQDYLDPDSRVMDTAINVESILYDSGFTLDTKKELCNFIALRKDTFVSLSTWDVCLNQPLSVADEQATALALRTRLELFPESTYFGTPVMRGMVVGHSGKLRGVQYQKRVSPLAEIAIKSARYMGAGNERWKNGFAFDAAPGSILEYIYDIAPDFIPASTKPLLWDEGLVWVQPYDRRSFFFPALQTVYYNDTSVLNSYFTALAICYINKVAHRAWRRFTGTSGLTNAQFADRVKQYVTQELAYRFDNRYITIPEVIFTQADLTRGYSWTLVVKIGSPNMKTVMTTYVEAYRIEDLQQA
jgi:hypothetical protein